MAEPEKFEEFQYDSLKWPWLILLGFALRESFVSLLDHLPQTESSIGELFASAAWLPFPVFFLVFVRFMWGNNRLIYLTYARGATGRSQLTSFRMAMDVIFFIFQAALIFKLARVIYNQDAFAHWYSVLMGIDLLGLAYYLLYASSKAIKRDWSECRLLSTAFSLRKLSGTEVPAFVVRWFVLNSIAFIVLLRLHPLMSLHSNELIEQLSMCIIAALSLVDILWCRAFYLPLGSVMNRANRGMYTELL